MFYIKSEYNFYLFQNSITTTNTSHSYSLSASAVDSPNNNGGQFFNFDNKSKIQGRGCSPSPSFVTDEKKNKIKLASRQASTNSSVFLLFKSLLIKSEFILNIFRNLISECF